MPTSPQLSEGVALLRVLTNLLYPNQAHVQGCPPPQNFAFEGAPKLDRRRGTFQTPLFLGQRILHPHGEYTRDACRYHFPMWHIILKSDSTMKTMSSSLQHASWNLFPINNASWIESLTRNFPKHNANTYPILCWLSCPIFWCLYQTQC